MVFAEGEDVEVLDDHHLVVGFMEDGALEDFPGILAIPGGKEADRLVESFRGLLEPLAIGVLSDLGEQVADEFLHNGDII